MRFDASSFRDPSSKIAYKEGKIIRYIHENYLETYNHFVNSGLYNFLLARELIIEHREEHSSEIEGFPIALFPNVIPFISYPYEWSFSQIKSAALLTLKINKIAIEFGMILKDASIFNVQFIGYKPIFIDTASFEMYNLNQHWNGYQQFCRHFFAPLALSKYSDLHLRKLFLSNIDGIPLSLCCKVLPKKAFFNSAIFFYVH